MNKNNKGFTLIELISVIVILSLLIVLIMPSITNVDKNSKTSLKESKISTIETAAEKYSNDRINDFQKCLGDFAPNEASCKVSIDTLIQKGYLYPDDEDASNITNPITGETFSGDILICYNPLTVNTYASYSESNDYSCGSVDIEMGNSFRLGSTNGEAYVNGSPVNVKIISGGTFDSKEPFSCSSPSPYVSCSIDASKNLLILQPSNVSITDPSGEATATIVVNGNYSGGTLSAEYKLRIKNTKLEVQDAIPYCLETGKTSELPLDLLNNGKVTLKASNPKILDGYIKGQKLVITTGQKTGTSSLTLVEDNGNRSDTLEKNVYKLEVGQIPSTIILGLKETIPVNYGGTGQLEITSSNPKALLIESANQKEGEKIVLSTGESNFTLVAKSYTIEPVTITIRGTNGCGVFTSQVTVENTRLNIIDDTSSCMEIDTERTLALDALNVGKISLDSSLPDTLGAYITDNKLNLIAKSIPGRATITLSESNSNKKASITKDIYKFEIAPIPNQMMLGKVEPIAVDFGGLGTLTITSSNPDKLAFSTSNQSMSGKITLTSNDKSFNLIAKAYSENEDVDITITSENNCIEKHFKTKIGDFRLSSSSGTFYVGGSSKTITIETDNTNTLRCTSSNSEVARCTLIEDKLIVEPWLKSGNALIKVINEAGTSIEYSATVLDISLKVVDPYNLDSLGLPTKLETMCSEKGSSVNSTKARVEGKNYGNLSIILEEPLLASSSIIKEGDYDFANINGKYLSSDFGSYHSGYNTGRTLVTVKESILGKEDNFYYNVYSLESDKEIIKMKVDEYAEFTVDASNTGKLTVSSSNPKVAEAFIIDDDIVNFGPNVIDSKTIQVNGHGVGKTTLTIHGANCGTITVPVEVEGKEYSIKIVPGKYTSSIYEQTLSCITEGTDKSCDVTLPEIPSVDGKSEPIGYYTEADSLDFIYVSNGKVTLNNSYNNFTLYANSKELISPNCSSMISDELVYNNIGDSYFVDVTCLDNESGIIDDFVLNKEDFYTSNSSGEVASISNIDKLENGISFRVEVKSKTIGLYDLILPANKIEDNHGNGNQYTVLGNFSAYEYEPVEVINIGIPDPYDEDVGDTLVSDAVVAVIYRNRDILNDESDDTYTLNIYGKNGGTMVDFMTESYSEFPKWTLEDYIDENSNNIDYKNKITKLVVYEGVKNIGNYLMYGVSNLNEVLLPEGITYIGEASFSSTNLNTIDIPDSVVEIRTKAFENTPLESLNLGLNLNTILNNAFFNNQIRKLIIPSNVQSIKSYAFYQPGEIYLNTITINESSELVEVGESAFPDLSGIEVNLPYEIESLEPFKRRDVSSELEPTEESNGH